MKKLIYFVVILIATVALIPWLDGLYFKQKFQNFIIAINQNTRTKVTIAEYHTGWLTSHIKLNVIATNIAPIALTLDETVTHGPIVYDKSKHKFTLAMAYTESNLHLPQEIETALLNNQQTQGVLQISSIAYFGGIWVNHFQIPSFNNQSSNEYHFSWEGLKGDSTIRVANGQIAFMQSNCVIGTLSVTTTTPANIQINARPITLSYSGTLHPIGLWVGSLNLSVPNFSIQNSRNMNLTNLSITTKNDITSNHFYNGTENITLQKIEFPGSDIITIAPATITLAANNFDAKGVAELLNYLRKTPAADLANNNSNQLFLFFSKIITPTSTLNGNVSFNTSLGAFVTNGNLSNFSPTLSSFNEIFNKSNLLINVRVSIPLANKLLESYFQTSASQNNNNVNQTIDQTSVELFNEKIADLMRQGKLSLSASMQVLTLRSQDLTPNQFSAGLANLHLPQDSVTQISQIYMQILIAQQTKQAKMPPLSASDRAKALIDQWVKQKYLIQDNNDYIASITRENGITKVNGNIVAN